MEFQNYLSYVINYHSQGHYTYSKSTSNGIIDYEAPWVCKYHALYYLSDKPYTGKKKFPYWNNNCKECKKSETAYNCWISYCKIRANKFKMKYGLWNNVKSKLLAANLVDKYYYFTDDKLDSNLIIKNQMNLELLSKFENKTNENLIWYAL